VLDVNLGESMGMLVLGVGSHILMILCMPILLSSVSRNLQERNLVQIVLAGQSFWAWLLTRPCMQVVIHEAKRDCYAATVNGNLIIRLGATHWAPSLISPDLEDWTVAMTGYHFTIWLRSSLQMPEDPAAAFRRGRSSKLPLSAMSAGPST
jgi:hypothetical protein